jgi:AsmA-like C-terminal region
MALFLYLRFDDEIRRGVQEKLSHNYPKLTVRVGKARFENGRGILVYDLAISEAGAPTSQVILSADEVLLAGNIKVQNVVSEKLPIERVVVRRPHLHATRRADGGWSFQSLLPLPHWSDQSPEIVVEDATLVVEDTTRPNSRALVLRGVDIVLSPMKDEPTGSASTNGSLQTLSGTSLPVAAHAERRFHVTGTATSSPARELKFSGTLNADNCSGDLNFDIRSLEVSPDLVASIPCEVPVQFSELQLYGKADAKVRVWRTGPARSDLGWSAEATLSRGRLDYPMLPQPLTDLAFQLQSDTQHLFIKQLTGKLGAADVSLALDRNGWTSAAPFSLAGRIGGLVVDDHLRAAFPTTISHILQRFQPTGLVNVDAKVTYDGQHLHPDIAVQCRGISLTDAEKFPYPVEQATGIVHVLPATENNDAAIHVDLEAQGNGQPIRIRADVANVKMPAAEVESPVKPIVSVEVSGNGIAIHERLLAALSEKCQRFVRSLAPEGTIDFDWRYDRADPSQLKGETSLTLRLVDCGIQYDRFAYPLQHIHGLVTSHNSSWKFEKLESRDRQDATTAVTCEGQSEDTADGLELQLAFAGTNVPLDENLRRALSPAVQKVWSDLRPQGSVDFTTSVTRRPSDSQPVIQVDLRPHEQTVAVEPTFFPYRFEQIGGRALITANKVELQQMSARHGRSGFAAQGIWQAAPDGGWQLALTGLNADRVTADPEFLAALPPGVQRVIDRLKPSGTIDMLGTTLQFAKRPGAAQLASSWDVQLACHQTALRGDLSLDSLTGGVRLMGQSDGPTSYSYGELAIDSLIWNDTQLTNIHGPFWADNTMCYLGQGATTKLGQPPRRMTADAYGGTLASDIQLQHEGHPIYHVDVSLGGVDLRRIISERLGGPKDLTGTVSGKLALDGAGRSTYALAGKGELHVVDANIYKLPVLVALLKVLSNRSPDTTAFDRCDADFQIHGEQIHFDHLNLLGDALSLYGRGDTNFDRNLNLTFYSLVGPGGFTVPILSSMAGQASKQMLQLKVDGSIDNPQIHREAFPAVNQALQQIQAELQRGVPPAVPGAVEPPAPVETTPVQASSPWGPQRR